MAGLIGKLVFGRILKETRENNRGHDEDPYFEVVPTKKMGTFTGKPQLKKRKKALPPGLSEEDQATLVKVKRRAYRLDMALGSILGMKVGWSSVIGIIPAIGDVIDLLLALLVVRTASRAGLSSSVYIQMIFNIAVDFVLGLVPFLGDIADMAYKANTRNAILLENHLRERGRQNLRKSGLPPQIDLSLGEVEEDVETGTVNGHNYSNSSRGYGGTRRDYDPESHRGIRGGDGSSRDKSHKVSKDKSSKSKHSKSKHSKGHSRLESQETGTTAPRY